MFAQIYKGFGLHRFWNCLAAFDGAAVRVLSVLVAVLLMSLALYREMQRLGPTTRFIPLMQRFCERPPIDFRHRLSM